MIDNMIDKTFDTFNRPFDSVIGEPPTLTPVTPSRIQPEKNGTGITMQTSSGDVIWYDSRFEAQALSDGSTQALSDGSAQALSDGSDCKSISGMCIPELDVSNNTTFSETTTATRIIEVALQSDDKGPGTPETAKTEAAETEATEEIRETDKTRETEGIADIHDVIHDVIGTEIPSVSQSKYSVPPERPTHAPAVGGPTPPIPAGQEENYDDHRHNINTHTDDQANQERDHGYNNQNVGYQSDQNIEKTKIQAGQDLQSERHENNVEDTSQELQENDQIDNRNDEIGLTNTTITNTEIDDIDTDDDSIETNFNYKIANKKRTANDSELEENAGNTKRLKPNEN